MAYFTHADVFAIVWGLMCTTVVACNVIDALRHRRLHPVLLWGGVLVVAVNSLTYLAQQSE